MSSVHYNQVPKTAITQLPSYLKVLGRLHGTCTICTYMYLYIYQYMCMYMYMYMYVKQISWDHGIVSQVLEQGVPTLAKLAICYTVSFILATTVIPGLNEQPFLALSLYTCI